MGIGYQDKGGHMKKIILVITICFIAQVGFADIYAVFDKETGKSLGVSDIQEKALLDWSQKHVIRKVGKEFRGKQSYEIKYQNGKVRLATKKEVSDYLAQKEQEKQTAIDAKKKQEFLKWLDDVDVKTKVKNIKSVQ